MQRSRFAIGLILCSLSLASTTWLPADEPDAQVAPPTAEKTEQPDSLDPKQAAAKEAEWLTGTRQLTFSGRRSGEGYYSADGTQMVFQSEREPGNPFYQIYLLDLETGDLDRVSPGTGKTTCAWIHPQGDRVLFASTQKDPQAKTKQDEEIAIRESGKQRRYSWDYDSNYDLMQWDRTTQQYKQLTDAEGYDAEGSYSPNGEQIVFASNRVAYERELTDKEAKLFKLDPAAMMDLYIADADGSNPVRLTDTLGYDGGPFFSPDGQRICFRRFAENGATAEVMTIAIDGSDPQQLTHMNAMSWAPYYHPSGDYLIFTTNRHGFANFELYLVDAAGAAEPVRVTYTDGFDGLPVFSPDGKQLSWSTNRTPSGNTQIFTADWNDARARQLLGLDKAKLADSPVPDTRDAEELGRQAASKSQAAFEPTDIMRHVDYLCRRELGGRLTGTPGEKAATAYVAAYLENLGLKPAGADGSFFQDFEFTAGVELGQGNTLQVGEESFQAGTDWQPLAFSKTGDFEPAGVVFAGYGIVAPGSEAGPEHDAYVHLDVEDKWVMVFRHLPADISAELRQQWSAYSSLRFKAMVARDRGARGLIVVSGPTSKVREQLVPLRFDGSLSGTSLGVISVTDAVAAKIVKAAGEELPELQKAFDSGEPQMGFDLGEAKLTAKIDVHKQQRVGRNVIGRLQVGDSPSSEAVLIGAHIDHLGTGASGSSLARDDERNGIHVGADDNASGVAAMLEVAQYLADMQRRGKLPAKRDLLLAAWSGEELGLLGSDAFADHFYELYPHVAKPEGHPPLSLYPAMAACLNMDMVGRLREKLVLQGIGSSPVWNSEIERRNAPVGLALTLQSDTYLPTDASTFYLRGVPILSAFTGSHSEYHTPRDTPDTLNYEGAAQTAHLMGVIARSLATAKETPQYTKHTAPQQQARAQMRAYLGTIPDYAAGDVKGVLLSGVAENGPTAKGGVQGGDLIIELAGRKIENIYDYTYAIEALKIGEEVVIRVRRGDRELELKVTPSSRE